MQGQESVRYIQPRAATPSERLFAAAHQERKRRIEEAANRVGPPMVKTRPYRPSVVFEVAAEPSREPETIAQWIERQRAIPFPPKPEPVAVKKGRPAKVQPSAEPMPIFPPIIDIQCAVARFYETGLNDLLSARRTKHVVRQRQVAMYLAKTLTSRSLPDIGRRFGGRDHTTVLHAVRKIDSLIPKEPVLAAEIEAIRATIPDPNTAAMPVE